MGLDGTNVLSFFFVSESSRTPWELGKYPLHWCKSSVACHFIQGRDAFGQSHVNLVTPYGIRFFDHFVEHVLQGLIPALDPSYLFRTFEGGSIEPDSLLGEGVAEHTSVMHSTVTCNHLGPTEGSRPAFGECVEAIV